MDLKTKAQILAMTGASLTGVALTGVFGKWGVLVQAAGTLATGIGTFLASKTSEGHPDGLATPVAAQQTIPPPK